MSPTPSTGIARIPLGRVCDNPYQTRTSYDGEAILNLAQSIKRLKGELPTTLGLQQIPLARVVTLTAGEERPAERADYSAGFDFTRNNLAVQLAFGHSRFRAFLVLDQGLRALLRQSDPGLGFNLRSVMELETRFADLLEPDSDYRLFPVTLGHADNQAMWTHAVTENAQRRGLSPVEEARAIQRAKDEFGLSDEEAGKPFGYARSTTANKLRLLQLPSDVQGMIARGDLTERHGRELVRVADDPARVTALATEAVTKGKTVRDLTTSVAFVVHEREQAAKPAEPMRPSSPATVARVGTLPTAPADTTAIDRERKRQAVEDEATRLWVDGLRRLNKAELWTDMRFWQLLAKRLGYNLSTTLQSASSVPAATDALLKALWDSANAFDRELACTLHQPATVQAILDALRTKTPTISTSLATAPDPESVEVDDDDWREGWDQADETRYQRIREQLDTLEPDAIEWRAIDRRTLTVRVCRRLMEEYHGAKQALGKVLDELVARETHVRFVPA